MNHKLVFFPVLLVAACVVSAVYGALHNQISYTVSPEFFHTDLFFRFDTPKSFENRAGASIVGALSSWWMGLLIGPPVLLVGLALPGWKAYLKHSLIAFGVVMATALVVGLIGLAVGFLVVDASNAPMNIFVSQEGAIRMGRAGTMHNFGYLGGFLGIFTGLLYLFTVRKWLQREPSAAPPGLDDL